jgi:virginiamycin B lyase
MRSAFHLLLALTLALPLPLAAAEKHHVEIKEWPVPWPDSRPRDPYVTRPGAVWFVGQTGNYLATLNPRTGDFKRIDLIDEPGPRSVVVAANGMVWYTGNLRGYLGRYDPRTRTIAHIPMPDPRAADPHTLVLEPGERNIWFTVQAGNIIGRLRIASQTVDLVAVPTPNAQPDGIAAAPNGNPWIALSGTNKLATVDPETFVLTEHALPRAAARPRRLGFTTDGRLWYVDFAEGYLGAFTPGTGAVKEWRLPGGKDSRPYGMAVDSQDRIWAVETGSQPNTLVGFDPKKERFFSTTAVPSGGGAIRNMHYDRGSGRIWFGTDTNTIGYAKVN